MEIWVYPVLFRLTAITLMFYLVCPRDLPLLGHPPRFERFIRGERTIYRLMKKLLTPILLFILAITLVVACTPDDAGLTSPATERNAQLGLLTPDGPALTADPTSLEREFTSRFPVRDVQDVKVTYEKSTGQYYLYAEGLNIDDATNPGSVRVMRLTISANDQQQLVWNKPTKTGGSGTLGESCTGHGCEKCVFASSGGCLCERHSGGGSDGTCDHTITKD